MALFSGPFHPAADLSVRNPDEPWLVPGIVPVDGVTILSSPPKTGKTCFATALARALATGGEFLGHQLKQAPVLWCAHEESPRERLALHKGLTIEDPLLVAYPDQLPMLDTPEPKTDRYGRWRDVPNNPYVFNHAVEVGAKLIVIDCLHAAVERGNLADNAFARKVVGRLRRWSHYFHVSVLVLHHLTKSSTRGHEHDRFADSAQILASASCHFLLQRKEGVGSSRSHVSGTVPVPSGEPVSHLTLYGQGREPSPPRKLELVSRGILDYQICETQDEERRKQTSEERILTLLEDGWSLTAEELAKRLEINPSTVRRTLADLVATGQAARQEGPTRKHRYSLPLGSPN